MTWVISTCVADSVAASVWLACSSGLEDRVSGEHSIQHVNIWCSRAMHMQCRASLEPDSAAVPVDPPLPPTPLPQPPGGVAPASWRARLAPGPGPGDS